MADDTNEQLKLLLDEVDRLKQETDDTKNEPQQTEQDVMDTSMQDFKDLPVTTLEDLGQYAKGQKVRFPDFAEGQPFVARVKRPSLLVLSKQGKIPNSLLNSATSMFTGGSDNAEVDKDTMSNMYDVIEVIAEAALIEPTFKMLKEAGIDLSDNQLMAIFNYSQNGIKALDSFRQK